MAEAMKGAAAPLAALLLLSGCGTGYAIDRLRPKTYLVNPQLARYGLSPAQVECVGSSLAQGLSAWQMRLLAMKTGAVMPGGDYPDRLTPRDLMWAASHVKDPAVPEALTRATASCEVPVVQTESIANILPLSELPPPTGQEEPSSPAEEKAAANGPPGYIPDDDLLKAIDAYEKGDFATAARLGKAAADRGDSGAYQFLGGLYSVGHGVAADPTAAVRYYGLAAEQGWSEAMNNLGRAYEMGEGVQRNAIEALKWYSLASARTTEDPEMVQRNIRSVVAEMSVDDIDTATSLARRWEQAHRR